jgi:hypothetical protein
VNMLRPALVVLPMLLLSAAPGPVAAQAPALELKRVLLSAGGVGYFEFEAQVEGDAELALPVRLDQVDDVLKSIVVFDDKGGVGAISLPGREPLGEAFRDLPFDQQALESPQELLNALRGAEVTVGGPRQASGRILKAIAEQVRLPGDGGTVVRHRVTLIAPDGMRQFVLEEAESVRFADPAIQRQVDQALATIARHRVQDQRILQIAARGAGRRSLRVGYVAAAPLWKASYRLTAPDTGAAGKALIQGWAVLENLSGRDWRNVELTLVSGNPVTFRQQLYTAYFVNRPEVPVEVLGRVLPPPDQGVLGMADARARVPSEGAVRPRASFAAPPAAVPAQGAPAMGMAPPPAGPAELVVAESQEAATQVLFVAPAPVSVKAGDSLSLPIVHREVPVERMALYQAGVHAAHPLAALRVTNDTGAGLPPGVLTLYERGKAGVAYVGDARLSPLPVGENRLLSFAVDQKVQVDREQRSRESVSEVRVSRGTLTLAYRDEQITSYRIKAPPNEDRAILIEQPRLADWELVSPRSAEVELTRGHYRIRQVLGRGGAAALDVVVQRPRQTVVQLAGLNQQAMLGYARTAGVPEGARQALERLAGMQAEVDRFDRQIKEIAAERETIAKDQVRLRDNLKSVPAGSDLAKRYLDSLKAQEDRLDGLRAAEDEAKQKLQQARAVLADAIAKLEL